MLLHLSIILLSNSRLGNFCSYVCSYEPNSHDFTGLRRSISFSLKVTDYQLAIAQYSYIITQNY